MDISVFCQIMGTSRKESGGNLKYELDHYVQCRAYTIVEGFFSKSLMPRTAARKVDPVRNNGCSKVLLKKDVNFLSECLQSIMLEFITSS